MVKKSLSRSSLRSLFTQPRPQYIPILRFDLLFVVLDVMDPEHDARIAEFVLRMHRYRNPGEVEGKCSELFFDIFIFSFLLNLLLHIFQRFRRFSGSRYMTRPEN